MSAAYEASLREEAYDLVVLSPHLDDAVYSLAATLLAARAAGRRVLVVTVFGHGREVAPHGRGAYDDYATREREDRAAMAALDVDHLWLNRPEWAFRRSRGGERWAELVPHASFAGTSLLEETRAAILDVIAPLAAEGCELYAPLAVGAHPDHRLVHEASRALGAERLRFYEDVPYALSDALVEARLAVLCALPGPRSVRVATAMTKLAFQGLLRLLALGPLSLFVAIADGARRLGRRLDPRIDPLGLAAIDRDVRPFASQKAHAMKLYASQTWLFFEREERLEAQLAQRAGGLIERCWTFATLPSAIAPSSPRRPA